MADVPITKDYQMQRIEHPNPARRSSRFVSAIKAGNTIYVAGQIGTDWDGKLVGENDIEAQSQQFVVKRSQILPGRLRGLLRASHGRRVR